MKNNDKNVKSFERAKKGREMWIRENSDTALQVRSVQCSQQSCSSTKKKALQERGKPEESMNKNGTESRTYFMLLSITPTLIHLLPRIAI